MSSFWPEGISIEDVSSPKEILESAQNEWEEKSQNTMALVLQETESESGNSLIIVHAKHIARNRTAELFSVIHRKMLPYPATISPKTEDIPLFLQKEYSVKKKASSVRPMVTPSAVMADVLGYGNEYEQIRNTWVADTPAEFREKLALAFNLGIVKRLILNLASGEDAQFEIEEISDSHDGI